MSIFKKKNKTVSEEVIETKDPTFVETEKARIETLLKDETPGTERYAKLQGAYRETLEHELKEANIDGKEIENTNKAQEPELKKAELKAGIVKTGITAGGGIIACVAIPFIEQKIGPAMSKIANHAQSAIFKNKT